MSGIFLSPKRKQTAVPITIDGGALGKAVFHVRPLIYTEQYEQDIQKARADSEKKSFEYAQAELALESAVESEVSEFTDKLETAKIEMKNAINRHGALFMQLFADWELFAPLDQIVETCEKSETEVLTYATAIDTQYIVDAYFELKSVRPSLPDKKGDDLKAHVIKLLQEAGMGEQEIESLLLEATLYKIPICIEAMNLFTKLEGSNLSTLILEGIRKIPLSTTVSGPRRS